MKYTENAPEHKSWLVQDYPEEQNIKLQTSFFSSCKASSSDTHYEVLCVLHHIGKSEIFGDIITRQEWTGYVSCKKLYQYDYHNKS